MKHWILIIAIMTLVLPSLAFADQMAVGQVDEEEGQQIEYVTVPAYHDATGRTQSDWDTLEVRLYRSAPGIIKGQIFEMLNAEFPPVHPPICSYHRNVMSVCPDCKGAKYCAKHYQALISCDKCGYYVPNTNGHYQAIYQAWVAPEKVTVPVVRGKDGRDGAEGREGRQGPKGDKGDAGTGITNNYFSTVPAMSMQIGGQAPAMVNNIQLMQMQLIPTSDTNICVSTRVNVANSNTLSSASNNVINVGPGSATGAAVANGSSAAGSGN